MRFDSVSLRSLGAALLAAASLPLGAQQPLVPPGVPEPGLVIWGHLVNATSPGEPLLIESVNWSVSDGIRTALLTAHSRPAVRIRNLDGHSLYVLEVPFDTRSFGPIALAEPVPTSFELQPSAAPVLTLLATANGQPASIHAIDRNPASGSEVAIAGLASAERGRVVRVDLAIQPAMTSYAAWATAIWGSASLPQAAPLADPDGDGLNNGGEFEAGTDPTNPTSTLRLLTLSVDPATRDVSVQWLSVADRNYQLETATDVNGPWREVGAVVPGTGATTQARLPDQAAEPRAFYRLRLAP